MSNKKTLTTIYLEKEYEHGTIEVTKKDNSEWDIKVNIECVISIEDYEKIYDELRKLIGKYAL